MTDTSSVSESVEVGMMYVTPTSHAHSECFAREHALNRLSEDLEDIPYAVDGFDAVGNVDVLGVKFTVLVEEQYLDTVRETEEFGEVLEVTV